MKKSRKSAPPGGLAVLGTALALLAGAPGLEAQTARPVAWGTRLDARAQTLESRALAAGLANPQSPGWRAKGDQRRSYRFPAAGVDLPYRVCVPSTWNGRDPLPLVVFLHGAGNDESSYLDQNNRQMVRLAEAHRVILVSPSGHQGAYGTFIRLPAVFDEQAEADKLMAQVTAQSERANELSEKDVINVLEMVLGEYPVDSARIFLMGHSMGSGGTWYLGGKYAYYWRALAPMSGPFVLSRGYPWEAILDKPVFVTEGSSTASTQSSRRLRDWMRQQQGRVAFKEVDADHAGMVPLVLPDVFAFFDSVSAGPAPLRPARLETGLTGRAGAPGTPGGIRAFRVPDGSGRRFADSRGRTVFRIPEVEAGNRP